MSRTRVGTSGSPPSTRGGCTLSALIRDAGCRNGVTEVCATADLSLSHRHPHYILLPLRAAGLFPSPNRHPLFFFCFLLGVRAWRESQKIGKRLEFVVLLLWLSPPLCVKFKTHFLRMSLFSALFARGWLRGAGAHAARRRAADPGSCTEGKSGSLAGGRDSGSIWRISPSSCESFHVFVPVNASFSLFISVGVGSTLPSPIPHLPPLFMGFSVWDPADLLAAVSLGCSH